MGDRPSRLARARRRRLYPQSFSAADRAGAAEGSSGELFAPSSLRGEPRARPGAAPDQNELDRGLSRPLGPALVSSSLPRSSARKTTITAIPPIRSQKSQLSEAKSIIITAASYFRTIVTFIGSSVVPVSAIFFVEALPSSVRIESASSCCIVRASRPLRPASAQPISA